MLLSLKRALNFALHSPDAMAHMPVAIGSPALWLVDLRDGSERLVEGHPTLVLVYAEAAHEKLEEGQPLSIKGLNFGGRESKPRSNVLIQHASQKKSR